MGIPMYLFSSDYLLLSAISEISPEANAVEILFYDIIPGS